MPFITVESYKGRTIDEKRKLAKSITKVIADGMNVSEQAVTVVFKDLEPHDLSIGGELFIDRGK
jgi:4-oxalocrotonate tautomerase